MRADQGFLEFRPYRRHDPSIQPLCFIVPPPKAAPPPAAARSLSTKSSAGLAEVEQLKLRAAEAAVARGGVELARFESWLSALCKAQKEQVLRCKAVVHVKGKDEKYMVQGVRDLLSIEPRQKWGKRCAQSTSHATTRSSVLHSALHSDAQCCAVPFSAAALLLEKGKGGGGKGEGGGEGVGRGGCSAVASA